MDWLDRFNAAIYYIESNLDSKIEYSSIARAAYCSEYHFYRMFSSWSKANKDGLMQTLIDMSWINPKSKLEGIIGICSKEAAIMDEEFDYFMGVRYDLEVPDGMEELMIPPCTYAVFTNIVDGWKRLYSEWLSASGYDLANQPCIENYLAPGSKIEQELWVPIIEK